MNPDEKWNFEQKKTLKKKVTKNNKKCGLTCFFKKKIGLLLDLLETEKQNRIYFRSADVYWLPSLQRNKYKIF